MIHVHMKPHLLGAWGYAPSGNLLKVTRPEIASGPRKGWKLYVTTNELLSIKKKIIPNCWGGGGGGVPSPYPASLGYM